MKKFVAAITSVVCFISGAVGLSACGKSDKFSYTLSDNDTYAVEAKDVYDMPQKVVLPSEYKGKPITSVKRHGFYGCTDVTEIVIPDGVTVIGEGAFEFCANLTEVTIPTSVTNIEAGAFYSCKKLTSVIVPDGVSVITYKAFSSCKSLEKITIPASIINIGLGAFAYCTALTSVTYGGTIEQWNDILKDSYWKVGVPSQCVVHCTDGDVAI